MSIGHALLDGIGRVGGAKRHLLVVYLVNLGLALVLGFALAGAIEQSLGSSLAANTLRDSFDELWYRGFSAQASGLAATFDPSVVGVGAVLNGLDTFLQGELFSEYGAVVGVGVLYLVAWTFFAGGFISSYRRPRASGSFFGQSARLFPRFATLTLMAMLAYWLIFHFAMPWLADRVASMTHESIDERVVFGYTVLQYGVIWCLVWLVKMVFDYSKILTAVEDRANVLTAPLAALRFVSQYPIRTGGLYLATGLIWVGLLALYWFVAPGAGQSTTWTMVGAFLIGQLYIVGRIGTKCLFYGGQTAMYESLR